MANPHILKLSDPEATLEWVGGKGASLARMSSSGLPVPDGFHITTSAYRQFVAENDLLAEIVAALDTVDTARPAALEAASRAIQDQFAKAAIPPDVASAIANAYGNLTGLNPVVAVRSSATAEDLPELSFAGQQETYLNIQGTEELLEAVKRCWASLWTARAIGYRAQHGIDADDISLAVVVQLLVPAEASGILFTADPITGQRDRALISAGWGLGEAVVGGMVTPDHLAVDKASCRVIAREVADKQVMTVRVNGGTEEQSVPEALRRAPVLDDETAARLTRLGVQIEDLYGMPMDVEWVQADGKISIVQARPITALAEPTVPVPTEWPMPDPKGMYARGSIVDVMPDPLTPLFSTLCVPVYNRGMARLILQLTGSRNASRSNWLWTINDYAYMGIRFTARQWVAVLFGITRSMPWLLRTMESRWRDEARPRYMDTIARWQAKPVAELSAVELLAGVEDILEAMVFYLNTLQSGTMGAAGGTEGLFTAVYDRLVKQEGDPDAPVFLMGYDSMPIRSEKALYDLAQWCREQPNLAAYLSQNEHETLLAHWRADAIPASVAVEAWTAWQARFGAYLERFGHTIYDLDFAKPVPSDDPTPLLEVLKMYLCGQGANPHERQQALAERREAASQAMLGRLRGLRLRIFRKTLGWAQWLAPLREDGIADIGLGYPLVRRMLRELGRRLATAEAIAEADDIFWLRLDEAQAAAEALDNDRPVEDFTQAIRKRKAVWAAEKQATPPSQLSASRTFFGIDMSRWLPAEADTQVGDTIKGLGASPGKVTAQAVVMHGPEDFDQMEPGAVLVAGITTPAWTPLFAMASAIVTDIGGPLSHGSIVAREYGIPAVLGTGVATKRIHSGQVITVDGSAGVVLLTNGKEAIN